MLEISPLTTFGRNKGKKKESKLSHPSLVSSVVETYLTIYYNFY